MNRVIDELETENVQPEEDNIKVTAARIHNFRSLKEVEVALDSTTILIGENNSGKTSVNRQRKWATSGTKVDGHLGLAPAPQRK